jgi:cysteine desulfurase
LAEGSGGRASRPLSGRLLMNDSIAGFSGLPIYLDHNATTPIAPEVREEMDGCLDIFGNPSSVHAGGQEARRVIDTARMRVARCIGAQADEILFTSGGTESNNLAILGSAMAQDKKPFVMSSVIEHQAVMHPVRHLEKLGYSAAFLPVDREGTIDIAACERAMSGDAGFVTAMLANNDTGTIQPVGEIARMAKRKGCIVHTDAVQAVGKIPVDVRTLGVDLLSFSSHKIYGPKGIGALYVRKGTDLSPLLFGGHQERGLRPGTENVAGIAGFGKACELVAKRLEEDAKRMGALRDKFEEAIVSRVVGASINGRLAPRTPNTTNIAFEGLDGEMLAIHLDLLGVAVSTGAACASSDREPSHVLLAMGRTPSEASSTIRVSLGRTTDEEAVRQATDRICQAVETMRRSKR